MNHKMPWLAVFLAAAVLAASAAGAAPLPEADAPLTTDQLIYQDTDIEVQVDVNGEAAAQLIGGLLDAVAEIALDQAAAIGEGAAGPGPPHVAAIAAPLIEPAKNVIKSITRISVLVMKPGDSVNPDEATTYYHDLMTSRGWTPMISVRSKGEERVLVLVAPGGKGVFVNVVERNEMVVAMVATTEPLGDLLAQVIRAGGGHVLQGIMAHAAQQKPAPEPPACEESAAEETPPEGPPSDEPPCEEPPSEE